MFSYKPAELEAKKKIKVDREMQTHRSLTLFWGRPIKISLAYFAVPLMQCINTRLFRNWTISETIINARAKTFVRVSRPRLTFDRPTMINKFRCSALAPNDDSNTWRLLFHFVEKQRQKETLKIVHSSRSFEYSPHAYCLSMNRKEENPLPISMRS